MAFRGPSKKRKPPPPKPAITLPEDPFWGPGGLKHNPQWLAIIKRLQQARQDMGWSQADLAVEMNGTQTSVYLWERGKVLPKLDRFLTWCDTLGFDPSALLEEVGL